ncbi:MAG: hypothetical protein IJ680_01835 [Paludibacteraceae bacterium]|nr:hypothetical protein [Paludibacteraceae bacterium]
MTRVPTAADTLSQQLGRLIGCGLKAGWLRNDVSGQQSEVFVREVQCLMQESHQSASRQYQYGRQLGQMMQLMQKQGIMRDTSLVFDKELFEQGIVNGLRGYEDGMTTDEAVRYVQSQIVSLPSFGLSAPLEVAQEVYSPEAPAMNVQQMMQYMNADNQ